jgi:hypothetical protein
MQKHKHWKRLKRPILKIASQNSRASHISHQSAENPRFFNKCHFEPIQYLFNNFSPFNLPKMRSIPVDRVCLALSPGVTKKHRNFEFWSN